jgi:protoporphyrinogen oxidase
MSGRLDAIIIGSGPAGCAAGVTLSLAGKKYAILDKLDRPGGLSRSIHRNGCTFDVGPHRFFTRSAEVLDIWQRTLQEDLISVNRLTRILYKGKLFNYPLVPINLLFGLGLITSAQAFSSYAYQRAKISLRPRQPVSFEDWIIDHFGSVLYQAFFKHYTEKVWGISCRQISADWASQRIKGLNLTRAVYAALLTKKGSGIKTLVDRFLYPRHGAGSLYERMVDQIIDSGNAYVSNATVTKAHYNSKGWRLEFQTKSGGCETLWCEHLLSSGPLPQLLHMLDPPPPSWVMASARELAFRNHYCVNLIIRGPVNLFPDNWIYVHSPEQLMGRIANFANFSSQLSREEGVFPVTVELFSSEGDMIDLMTDEDRISLGINEPKQIEFLKPYHLVEDAFVVFSRDAYLLMSTGYEMKLKIIREYLQTFSTLHPIGRAGLFKYNNQDHSIMTGILGARNVLGGQYDLWSVNEDAEYLESGIAPHV